MKRIFCNALPGILLALSGVGTVAAPLPPPPGASHFALYVYDLQKSTAFYRDVLELPQIPEPFKDGKHVWFRTGAHSQLHIIQGAAKVEPHDKNSHLAFSVKNLAKFTAHLDKTGVRYGSWTGEERQTTARPDGVRQVYLQDPDNFWVEVNDDPF